MSILRMRTITTALLLIGLFIFNAQKSDAGELPLKTRQEIVDLLKGIPPGFLSLEELLEQCGVPLNGLDMEQVVTDLVNRIQQQQGLSTNHFSQQFPEPETTSSFYQFFYQCFHQWLFYTLPCGIFSMLFRAYSEIPTISVQQAKALLLLALISERLINFYDRRSAPLPTSVISLTSPEYICLPDRQQKKNIFYPLSDVHSVEPDHVCNDSDTGIINTEHDSETSVVNILIIVPSVTDTFQAMIPSQSPPLPEPGKKPPVTNTRHWSEYLIPSGYNLVMSSAFAAGAAPCVGYELQLLRTTRVHGHKARQIENMQRVARLTGCLILSAFSLVATDTFWSLVIAPSALAPDPASDKPEETKDKSDDVHKDRFDYDKAYNPDEFKMDDTDNMKGVFAVALLNPRPYTEGAAKTGAIPDTALQISHIKQVYLAGGLTGLGCGPEAITVAAVTDLILMSTSSTPHCRGILDAVAALAYFTMCDKWSIVLEPVAIGETHSSGITTRHDYKTYLAGTFYTNALLRSMLDASQPMRNIPYKTYLQLNFITSGGVAVGSYWVMYFYRWVQLNIIHFLEHYTF